MPRPYLATISYFNGRYWSPKQTKQLTACSWVAAGGAAYRIAKKEIVPPRTRPEHIDVQITPIKACSLG
jgi:hypothetical protein